MYSNHCIFLVSLKYLHLLHLVTGFVETIQHLYKFSVSESNLPVRYDISMQRVYNTCMRKISC